MMNTDRIEEIQKTTAYPESRSVQQALLQVWNECGHELQECLEKLKGVAGARDYYRNILIKSEAQNKVLLSLLERFMTICHDNEVGRCYTGLMSDTEKAIKETAMNQEPIEQAEEN